MDEEKNEPEAQEPEAQEPEAEAPEAEAEQPAAEAEAEPEAEEPAAEAEEAEPEAEAEPDTEGGAEAAPEADAEPPAEPAAPAAPAKPRKTRAERRANAEKRAAAKARARAAATKPGERKPIVRVPKPEPVRGKRKERQGVVVSSAMDKTIVVRVDTIRPHPAYKKVVRRSKRYHAHDEQNSANVGDVVRIAETRPLSKTKSWRLVEILEAAK
jgi:small subunit ribosomal protein S17